MASPSSPVQLPDSHSSSSRQCLPDLQVKLSTSERSAIAQFKKEMDMYTLFNYFLSTDDTSELNVLNQQKVLTRDLVRHARAYAHVRRVASSIQLTTPLSIGRDRDAFPKSGPGWRARQKVPSTLPLERIL